MKTIVKFISILVIMFIITSCEKIYLENGKDGENAHNIVFGSKPLIVNDTIVIGSILEAYWDMDEPGEPGYGILSSLDEWKYSLPILNGTNGVNGLNGDDGGTSVISMEKVGDSLIFTTTINEVIVSITVILAPEDGISGFTPSLKTLVSNIGITYIWYIDYFPFNGDYDEGIDEKLSEETIPYAKDGEISDPFVSMTLEYDFQGASASYFSGTGFDSQGFSYNDGNIFSTKSEGYFSFPNLVGEYDLLGLTFNYGSTDSYKIVVKVIDMDDVESVVDTIKYNGNTSFNRVTHSTYSTYTYGCTDLNSIEFEYVKYIKVEVLEFNPQSNLSKCTNGDIFFDNFIMLFKKR